tara:strand:- start:457 stop:672 length:216 start_codon:yes stop_codon:yes gene_type:complete
MNIANNTIIQHNKVHHLDEIISNIIVGILVLCFIYCLFCRQKKEEREIRFNWGVERAQAKVALRNELAFKV